METSAANREAENADSNKSMSEGVKAMFSAIRQKQSPHTETDSNHVDNCFDTEDGGQQDQNEVFVKEGNRETETFGDASDKKQEAQAGSSSKERVRHDPKSDSSLEDESNREKKKTRRVVSESTIQNKVRDWLDCFDQSVLRHSSQCTRVQNCGVTSFVFSGLSFPFTFVN